MASEQRIELADLDACLAELDEIETNAAADGDQLDELRGRIETLMDEIEIMLGMEPPDIIPPEDYDL
jgi:ribosome assembly protein YihI (activator of Der GTPase)